MDARYGRIGLSRSRERSRALRPLVTATVAATMALLIAAPASAPLEGFGVAQARPHPNHDAPPEPDPTATTSPTGPTVAWGFNEDWGYGSNGWTSSLTTRHMQMAGAIMPDSLSANRFHVQWAKVESKKGKYNWSETDSQYAAMRRYTPKPVMLIFNAPTWARDPAATCPASLPCAYPPLSQYDGAWSKFVKAAISRYRAVRAIEVWNEPNLGRFFAPAPDPARYVALLVRAHDAAAQAGSTAPVLTGGVAPTTNTSTTIGAYNFLSQIYDGACNGGCARYFEGIGAHPYTTNTNPSLVENMTARLDKLRAARDEHLDNVPLWITEMGLSSDGTSGVTEDNQGDELVKLYRSTEGHDVAAFIIHRFNDIGSEGSYWSQTGVVYGDLSPKPAYCELWSGIGGTTPRPALC
jgi:polysaccharide biosynthesis protein PslG